MENSLTRIKFEGELKKTEDVPKLSRRKEKSQAEGTACIKTLWQKGGWAVMEMKAVQRSWRMENKGVT